MSKYFLLLIAGIAFTLMCRSQAPYPGPPPAPVDIQAAEYFFNTDPGFGKGSPIAITPSTNLQNLAANLEINGSALTNGFHYLHIRTRDAGGNWSHTSTSLFDNVNIRPYPDAPAAISDIVSAEYFIDTDPGEGNGTGIPITAAPDHANLNVLVNISGLNPGVHTLFVRSRNTLGQWSLTNLVIFDNAVLVPYPTAATVSDLVNAEYFLDTDPGFGNGTPISIPASGDISNFNIDIPLTGLTQGSHTLHIRSKADAWSLNAYVEFLLGSTLPVTWKYVRAEKKANDALITWATGAEENNSGFVVEYSADGVSFVAVGNVAATNNPEGSHYKFTHVRPDAGVAYYRIRQVDQDGSFTYSKVLMLLFSSQNDQPVAFPNPARDVIHVALQGFAPSSRVVVTDVSGKLVNISATAVQGNVVTLPINRLANGQYFIKISDGQKTKTVSFIKD